MRLDESLGGVSAERAARVLVVEDEPQLRSLLVDLLREEGYAVHEAADGAAALDLAGTVALSLIVLDMRLPVMNGWQFAAAYRALPGPHAPLLVLTAAQDPAEWAAEVGAAACLAKPFREERLRALARHLVAPTDAASGQTARSDAAARQPRATADFLADLEALLSERQALIRRLEASPWEPKALAARLDRIGTQLQALLTQLAAVVPPAGASGRDPKTN